MDSSNTKYAERSFTPHQHSQQMTAASVLQPLMCTMHKPVLLAVGYHLGSALAKSNGEAAHSLTHSNTPARYAVQLPGAAPTSMATLLFPP
jgi:hypothetical protein